MNYKILTIIFIYGSLLFYSCEEDGSDNPSSGGPSPQPTEIEPSIAESTTDFDGTTRAAVYIDNDISAMAAITIAAANS